MIEEVVTMRNIRWKEDAGEIPHVTRLPSSLVKVTRYGTSTATKAQRQDSKNNNGVVCVYRCMTYAMNTE
jgi:hypothetical protein